MEDIGNRVMFGSAGFFASVGLADINQVISLAVGVATLIFLSLSIYKILKEVKK
jgi:hypothetical protein